MHIAIWIFTLLGLALWSLLAWGLHALLSIDPHWLDDVEELIKRVPYADVIDRWFPGWQQMLAVAMDLAQTVLSWVGVDRLGHRHAGAAGRRRHPVADGVPAHREEEIGDSRRGLSRPDAQRSALRTTSFSPDQTSLTAHTLTST
jgi:hypothetical protein